MDSPICIWVRSTHIYISHTWSESVILSWIPGSIQGIHQELLVLLVVDDELLHGLVITELLGQHLQNAVDVDFAENTVFII